MDVIKLGAKILVADDNDVNRMVAKGMLENMGCSVILAENGEAAVELVNTTPVDIILMDINMPVMNGCDATRLIKESEHKTVPVIALTANVIQSEIDRYYDYGMDDHLAKPFSAESLRYKIQKWMLVLNTSHITVIDDLSVKDNFGIDINTVNNLKNIMGANFDDLLDTFMKRSMALKESVINNHENVSQMIHDVHSLKGSSGTMGATRLFNLCKRFESDLRNGDFAGRDIKIENILDELDWVQQELHKLS